MVRNLLQYPITNAEKLNALETLDDWYRTDERGIGDIRPLALRLAIDDLRHTYAERARIEQCPEPPPLVSD